MTSNAHAALSPEARTAVDRAVAFLHQHDDDRLGGKALAARVMLALDRPDDPLVERAVVATQAIASNPGKTDVYSIGMAIILLVELDPERYSIELRKLVDHLVSIQKPHGGWGYFERSTGDTSMTQYAVFGLWMAEQAGVSAPLATWEKVVNWLLRTQDPSGLWGYQGIEAKTDELVRQSQASPNMTVAALGSLYFCGHRLGLLSLATPPPEVHPDLVRVAPQRDAPRLQTEEVTPERFHNAMQRGMQAWLSGEGKVNPSYLWYYMYSVERLESLREAQAGSWTSEPAWYRDLAASIIARQSPSGAWQGREGDVPATSFAALVLLRSTRRVMERARGLGAGTLVGGRGLPAGEGDVALRLGQVAPSNLNQSAEELLDRLENPRGPDFATAVAALVELPVTSEDQLETPLESRLRALVGSEHPEARAAAIRVLGKARDLDHVPVLIQAIMDSDPNVHQAAWQALRYMRRRLNDTQPPPLETPAQRALEAGKWKTWYLSIRPEAVREF